MNYFAGSVWSYLEKMIYKTKQQAGVVNGRTLLVMVPALSKGATMALAEEIANKCVADNTLHLTLKIAQVITTDWPEFAKAEARAHNWLDDRRSLTSYRNLDPIPGKLRIIVLCGADRVTDAGSLSDFHLCDPGTIWQAEMKSSFQEWVKLKLQSNGIVAVDSTALKQFDRLIKPLLDQGRADLLQIGNWIETMNLNEASSVNDAMNIMLGKYDVFQLPKFTRFPLRRTNITLGPYIDKAHAFFSYSLFLDGKQRKKAKDTIDKILTKIAQGRGDGVTALR